MKIHRKRAAALGALATILLTACGSDSSSAGPAEPNKTIAIAETEYRFSGDPSGIVSGDVIRFDVSNVGGLIHEMQVLDPDGKVLDRTGEIPPGGSDEVVVEFAEPGDYRLICDIDDHQSRGQFAFITVAGG